MSSKESPEFNEKEPELTKDLERLTAQGIYTLLILVPTDKSIEVGALGRRSLPKGYYAYTGSALGEAAQSLGGRIRRHLRKANRKKRWHIDYLLSTSKVEISSVIVACTRKKMECEINRRLRDKLWATTPIRGFGSSDCRKKCGSHLLYLGQDEPSAERIAELYSDMVDGTIYIYRKRKAYPT